MPPATHKPPREDWTLEELQPEAEELRARLNRFRTSLGRFFVKKQELIDLMTVAAIARSRCCWSARPAPPSRTWC